MIDRINAPTAETMAAARRMATTAPTLVAAGLLCESLAVPDRTLFHAGPPYSSAAEAPVCVVNAAAAVAVAEGWASSLPEARDAVRGGPVRLSPAQSIGLVVPLAFVAGPSTAILTVECRVTGASGHAPLNDGPPDVATRFGAPTDAAVSHLRMLSERGAPALDRALKANPIPLAHIAATALRQGDELHASVAAANALLLEALFPAVFDAEVEAYLASAGQFFLNAWMAASLTMLNAGADAPGSTLVCGAGANGVRAGLRVSADRTSWLEQSAARPNGPRFSDDLITVDTAPAIGDSAVIEAAGFGARTVRFAPAVREAFAPFRDALPTDSASGLAAHPAFAELKVGTDFAALGPDAPMPAHFAMLDAAGEHGLIGRGTLDFWSR